MGPRLLFLFGIIVAHGALAAGWIANEMPAARNTLASTCVNTPAPLPNFTPRFQIYALNLRSPEHDTVMQP
jgi:hypothetical protein